MLTVPQAAKQAGVSESTIRTWIHNGDLDAVRVGNAYGIEEDDLQECIDSLNAEDDDLDEDE
jgi:excisionase family DNA binding protein